MFLKLGFFVLFICVLSQHNFVDANDHSIPGNFFRRIGDWQHARGDAWDRKAHIWHIFDKSDEPQETPIGNLKRGFGEKTYKFADRVDGWAEQGKGIVGQLVGNFITKSRNKGKQPNPSPRTTNPQPAPTAPTGGPYFPTTSVSTNFNANTGPTSTGPTGGPYFRTTSVSTSFAANTQPPNINSMFNPENIPFPPGYNPAPPTRNPSPPRPNPVSTTVGSYFPTSSGTIATRDPPATRSTAGKLVFIDSQGISTELSPEQIVDIGKYFDQLLKGSN